MPLTDLEENQALELIKGIRESAEKLRSEVKEIGKSNPGLDISAAESEIDRYVRNAIDRGDILGVDKKEVEGAQKSKSKPSVAPLIVADRFNIDNTLSALDSQLVEFGTFKQTIMTGLNAKIQELSKSKEEAAEKERIAKTAADLNAAMSKRLAEDNQKAADNAKKAADMAAKAKPPEPKAPVSPEDILAAVKAGFNKASEKSTIRTSSIFAKPAVEEKQPTTIEEAKEMTMALIEELNKLGHHYAKLPLDAAKSIEEVLAYKKELQGKLEIYKEASQASGIKQRRT